MVLLRDAEAGSDTQSAIELQARTLLKRYGVVFRRLLAREARTSRRGATWRGRIDGSRRAARFVAGASSPACPGNSSRPATPSSACAKSAAPPAHGRCLAVSAADPLNLAGIVTAGDRVQAVAANRLVYRDGVPIAALEGEHVRSLAEVDPAIASDAARTLTGNPALSVVSGFVGR